MPESILDGYGNAIEVGDIIAYAFKDNFEGIDVCIGRVEKVTKCFAVCRGRRYKKDNIVLIHSANPLKQVSWKTKGFKDGLEEKDVL